MTPSDAGVDRLHKGPIGRRDITATEAVLAQGKAPDAMLGDSKRAAGNAALRQNGPVPSGCAGNHAIRRCSSLMWDDHTTLLAPCLA